MLCLGAMALSKPIIYTDVSSINYYFQSNTKCGIPYQISDLQSLNSAINSLISYTNTELIEIGENARSRYINKYTKNKGIDNLINILCR